jgi:mRNA-degrading endonuclease RelE of RelBE toxin-antitoxin system
MEYLIRYARQAEAHVAALPARQQRVVIDAVERHLRHEPTVVTRTRKRMSQNPVAPWELRIGDLRAYYDVVHEPEPTVQIVAVGVKRGNQVRIGGKVVEL